MAMAGGQVGKRWTISKRAQNFLMALSLSALWMFVVHTHKVDWADILLVWLLGMCSGGLLVAWVDKTGTDA